MPKLIWREPIETTVITSAREVTPRTNPAVTPPPGRHARRTRSCGSNAAAAIPPPRPRVRVKTLGDIAGPRKRRAVVLLVAVGALTLASHEFLTGNNLANLARQVAIFGILAIGQLAGHPDRRNRPVRRVHPGAGRRGHRPVAGHWHADLPAILIGVVIGTVARHRQRPAGDQVQTATVHRDAGHVGYRPRHRPGDHRRQHHPGSAGRLPDHRQRHVLGIPNLLIIFAIITAIAWFVLTARSLGGTCTRSGSNPEAARLAGVPVAMVTTSVYVISGAARRLGGVLLTSRLGAGIPTAGTGFELQAIAACVIGGASLFGASGSAIGAACGALIIGVLNNGGNLLAINAFYLQIAIGALILVAVGFDQMNTRKAGRG